MSEAGGGGLACRGVCGCLCDWYWLWVHEHRSNSAVCVRPLGSFNSVCLVWNLRTTTAPEHFCAAVWFVSARIYLLWAQSVHICESPLYVEYFNLFVCFKSYTIYVWTACWSFLILSKPLPACSRSSHCWTEWLIGGPYVKTLSRMQFCGLSAAGLMADLHVHTGLLTFIEV